MAGSSGTSKNVGMTVTLNGTDALDILWQGGTDINSLDTINATVNGAPIDNSAFPEGGVNVGEITTLDAEGTEITGTRVIITGTFTDGTTQVLFDRRY